VNCTCYIDESGDEGIGTGGTRWFILGALIVDDAVNLQTSTMIPRIKTQFGWIPTKPLRWSKIRSHDKRLYMCKELLSEQWVFCAIVTDKDHPFVQTAKGLHQKSNLYFYSTRLLLERLSWYVRDNGGGKAKLVFEKRTNMDYKALNAYLLQLNQWSGQQPPQIAWSFLDWQNIRILPKDKSRLLQGADLACGALSDALEHTKLGNIEPRYILELNGRFYRRGTNLFSYGLKFLPVKHDVITEHGKEYEWLKMI
jgi:hypothetical protein